VGSYFGIDLSPETPMTKFSLLQKVIEKKASYHMEVKDKIDQDSIAKFPHIASAETGREFLLGAQETTGKNISYPLIDDFMDSFFMEFGLLIGVFHICLGMLRTLRRRYPGLGWMLAIWGGYLYFPSFLGASSMINYLGILPQKEAYALGLQLLILGISLSVILAFVQDKWAGLIEITKSIEIFADILSYLRLYALGLAGMILSATFNKMGQEAGLFFGFFIIVIGHCINIVVGIMGGVIHGLRLNFIEWYHHCFDGGGKLFSPLHLLSYEKKVNKGEKHGI